MLVQISYSNSRPHPSHPPPPFDCRFDYQSAVFLINIIHTKAKLNELGKLDWSIDFPLIFFCFVLKLEITKPFFYLRFKAVKGLWCTITG